MQNDKITLKDLSVFTGDGSAGIFSLIDHTITQNGKDFLRRHIQDPPGSVEALQKVQDVVKFWSQRLDRWPQQVSNGTMVMLEKFFEAADSLASPPSGLSLMFGSFF